MQFQTSGSLTLKRNKQIRTQRIPAQLNSDRLKKNTERKPQLASLQNLHNLQNPNDHTATPVHLSRSKNKNTTCLKLTTPSRPPHSINLRSESTPRKLIKNTALPNENRSNGLRFRCNSCTQRSSSKLLHRRLRRLLASTSNAQGTSNLFPNLPPSVICNHQPQVQSSASAGGLSSAVRPDPEPAPEAAATATWLPWGISILIILSPST